MTNEKVQNGKRASADFTSEELARLRELVRQHLWGQIKQFLIERTFPTVTNRDGLPEYCWELNGVSYSNRETVVDGWVSNAWHIRLDGEQIWQGWGNEKKRNRKMFEQLSECWRRLTGKPVTNELIQPYPFGFRVGGTTGVVADLATIFE